MQGLTISTLGIAMELSLLAFAATAMEWSIAGRQFMAIATFESVGRLLGVILMGWLQKTSTGLSGYAAGLLYYVDAVSTRAEPGLWIGHVMITINRVYTS